MGCREIGTLVLLLAAVGGVKCDRNPFILSSTEAKYAYFPVEEIENARSEAREMFYYGYENYMRHAFPDDELDPIHCTGRGHDHDHPENININDVLGDYSLTLIDSLDSLVVFGDTEEFKNAVNLVIETVSFDKNTTVQIFEATIRVMGSLLSAHLIASDSSRSLGDFYMADYDGELLSMAHDLAIRLMPAFEGTATGLPYTRVNLRNGVLPETTNETCTAGAGSLLLEFGLLSRLIGDDTYERAARRINRKIWNMRNSKTGLLGNLFNIQSGAWVGSLCGLGAGLDSFYEYLLKSFILFDDKQDLVMFNEALDLILKHMRRGRPRCLSGEGEHPLFVNVDARDGSTTNTWIDALQASFPGVLILAGDVEEAVCQHGVYYAIWKKYGVLPERYNWHLKRPDVNFYPLRPEFAESTYLLYRATKNPFYLHVGREIIDSINTMTKVSCGFATVHDVNDGSLEDRMESFFLAETMKYLYLLFDLDNLVNKQQERFLFSTEGHIFPIDSRFRKNESDCLFESAEEEEPDVSTLPPTNIQSILSVHVPDVESIYARAEYRNESCETGSRVHIFAPPLREKSMVRLFESVGLSSDWWN